MKLQNHTLFDARAIPLTGPNGYLLTVIVKGVFGFCGQVHDTQIPIAFGDECEDKNPGGDIRCETDIVPFKPKADIVLVGSAWAPDNKPVEWVNATLQVGRTVKTITVFGDRYWNHKGVLSRHYTITAAKPFIRKPIRYSDAFGGIDPNTGQVCPENLSGKGYFSEKTKARIAGSPLPCIEDPRHLIKTIKDHPKPAGFGFYHRAWQPRAALAGTYDQLWREKRRPLPPADFNPGFYNAAHPELQVEGYLKGDEPVQLIHLTPGGKEQFTLPGIAMHCWVQRTKINGYDPAEEEDVAMNLDTLLLLPDEQRYCLVWRGSTRLAKLSENAIERVTIGCRQMY
jgi:hypothetical protein